MDVESHYVVVREIDRAGASRIDPLAIIAGDQGRHWIGLAESFAAVGGVRAGDSGRQGQTDQGEIGDRREKSGVYRDIYIAPAWGETKVVTTVRQDAAAIRLTEVMEGQRSVSIGRRIQNRGPAVRIHSSGNAANTAHINCALIVGAVAGFETAHDEFHLQVSCGERKLQQLILAETVDLRCSKLGCKRQRRRCSQKKRAKTSPGKRHLKSSLYLHCYRLTEFGKSGLGGLQAQKDEGGRATRPEHWLCCTS